MLSSLLDRCSIHPHAWLLTEKRRIFPGKQKVVNQVAYHLNGTPILEEIEEQFLDYFWNSRRLVDKSKLKT